MAITRTGFNVIVETTPFTDSVDAFTEAILKKYDKMNKHDFGINTTFVEGMWHGMANWGDYYIHTEPLVLEADVIIELHHLIQMFWIRRLPFQEIAPAITAFNEMEQGIQSVRELLFPIRMYDIGASFQ